MINSIIFGGSPLIPGSDSRESISGDLIGVLWKEVRWSFFDFLRFLFQHYFVREKSKNCFCFFFLFKEVSFRGISRRLFHTTSILPIKKMNDIHSMNRDILSGAVVILTVTLRWYNWLKTVWNITKKFVLFLKIWAIYYYLLPRFSVVVLVYNWKNISFANLWEVSYDKNASHFIRRRLPSLMVWFLLYQGWPFRLLTCSLKWQYWLNIITNYNT